MSADGRAIVVDELVIGAFGPAPWSRIDFPGKTVTAAGIETFTALKRRAFSPKTDGRKKSRCSLTRKA